MVVGVRDPEYLALPRDGRLGIGDERVDVLDVHFDLPGGLAHSDSNTHAALLLRWWRKGISHR